MCATQDADLSDARPIVGYEDVATITRTGVVTTIDRVIRHRSGTTRVLPGGRVLKPSKSGRCVTIAIHRDGARHNISLSLLVAEAWIRPLTSDERVRHIDVDLNLNNLVIVPRSQARIYSTRVTGKRCNTQYKCEIWRDVPEARAVISNYGRLRSHATRTPSILAPVTIQYRQIVAFIRADGTRTSSTIGHLMRTVFPELVEEYQTRKPGRRKQR